MFKKLALLGVSAALVGFTALGAASSPASAEETEEIGPLQSSTIVINEVQTAPSTQAFVELRNISPETVEITGYQLLRCSAQGSTTPLVTIEDQISLEPGQYFLIAPNLISGVSPDVVSPSLNIPSAGGVVLRSSAATGSVKIDAVGFGAAAGACVEGAPAPRATGTNPQQKSTQRNHLGTDTDDNSVDFGLMIRSPQNSLSPFAPASPF